MHEKRAAITGGKPLTLVSPFVPAGDQAHTICELLQSQEWVERE